MGHLYTKTKTANREIKLASNLFWKSFRFFRCWFTPKGKSILLMNSTLYWHRYKSRLPAMHCHLAGFRFGLEVNHRHLITCKINYRYLLNLHFLVSLLSNQNWCLWYWNVFKYQETTVALDWQFISYIIDWSFLYLDTLILNAS